MLRKIEKLWCHTIKLGFSHLPPHAMYWDADKNCLRNNFNNQTVFHLINILNILIGFLSTCILLHNFLIRNNTTQILNFGQISILAVIVFLTMSSSLILYLQRLHASAIHGLNQLISLRGKIHQCNY